jgi:hypothetical protein
MCPVQPRLDTTHRDFGTSTLPRLTQHPISSHLPDSRSSEVLDPRSKTSAKCLRYLPLVDRTIEKGSQRTLDQRSTMSLNSSPQSDGWGDFATLHPIQVLAHLSLEGLHTGKVIKGIRLFVVGQHYRLPYPSTGLDPKVERDPKGSLYLRLALLHDFGIREFRSFNAFSLPE